MTRYFATVLMLVAAALLPAIAVADDPATACGDVAAYIAQVDQAVATGMADLASDATVRNAFSSAASTSATDGTGLLVLSPPEQDAVLAYLAVPAAALATIDDAAVPATARDLHDSATTHWETTPKMLRAIIEDGPSAALGFTGDLADAAETNARAAQHLQIACPAEITAWADASRAWTTDVDANNLARWENIDPESAPGAAYPILFYTQVTPANPDATPAATPTSR